MKSAAVFLVLAVAAVSAMPTPAKETDTKGSREGRTIIFQNTVPGAIRTTPVLLHPGMTLPSLQLPGLTVPGLSVPAMTLPSLTLPQHPPLQPAVVQELLDGVARFLGAVVQNALVN